MYRYMLHIACRTLHVARHMSHVARLTVACRMLQCCSAAVHVGVALHYRSGLASRVTRRRIRSVECEGASHVLICVCACVRARARVLACSRRFVCGRAGSPPHAQVDASLKAQKLAAIGARETMALSPEQEAVR